MISLINLQNYYWMAIRQNSGDLNTMKSATAASLLCVASTATMIFIPASLWEQIVG